MPTYGEMMIKKTIITLLLVSLMPTFAVEKVIYGRDNRVEVDEFADQRFVDAADSVAAVVWDKKITRDPLMPDVFNFKKVSLQFAYNVCKEERYSQQVPLGSCTAFLIAPDLVLTAGHCISSQEHCEENKFVFGHKKGVTTLRDSQVYSCKKVVERRLVNEKYEVKDYAVVQLDREVENRSPLSLRPSGTVKKNTPLVVIGHPLGLPMKIADNAKVTKPGYVRMFSSIRSLMKYRNYFLTNTDTYGGNSGSPVFNEDSGLVEGLLIQGADDFIETEEGCYISSFLDNNRKNREEKVLRILNIDNLKKHINDSYNRVINN